MTNEDKEFFKEMIAANRRDHLELKERQQKYDIPDLAFKALTSITMLLTMWVLNTVSEMKQTVSNIQIDNEYTKTSVESIRKFTEQPRFTQDDFSSKIEPIVKQLNINTTELNHRSEFIETTNSQLLRLELRIETLEKKVK